MALPPSHSQAVIRASEGYIYRFRTLTCGNTRSDFRYLPSSTAISRRLLILFFESMS